MNWIVDEVVPVVADDATAGTVVILAHGAGSHMDHRTLLWLADRVRGTGAQVVRFNFRYRALNKSVPDRMPVLTQTYASVIESVRERLKPQMLLIGGHSMGGRAASMLLADSTSAADGLLLFGYPLHPPEKLDKLRDAHLAAIKVPTLQINGTLDPFCNPDLMAQVLPNLHDWTLHWVEAADHSYGVRKSSGRTQSDVADEISTAVSDWLATEF